MKNRSIFTGLSLSIITIFSLIVIYKKKATQRFNFKRNMVKDHIHINKNIASLPGYSIISSINNHRSQILLFSEKEHILCCLDTTGKEYYKTRLDINLQGPYSIISDDSLIYTTHYNTRTLYIIDPVHQEYDSIPIDIAFIRGYSLAHDKLILKTLDDDRTSYSLKLYTPGGQLITPIEKEFTRKNDGGIASDGFFAPANDSMAFYIQFFTNSIYLIGPQGNMVYAKPSIAKPKEEIKVAEKDGAYTKDESAPVLNIMACADRNALYIISRIKANNESQADFSGASVIDTYTIRDGAYTSSFYIPAYEGHKISSLTTLNGSIYCMQGNYLVKYSHP